MNDEVSSQPQEQKSGFGWGTILFVILPAALIFNYFYDVTGMQGEFPFVQIIEVTKENRNAKQDNTRLKEKIADLDQELKHAKIRFDDKVADEAKVIKDKEELRNEIGQLKKDITRLKEQRDELRAAVAALKRN